jgi:hypothetical protein
MTQPETAEIIYEVECILDPSIVAAFDAWLPGHVRQVLACDGFTGAEIQAPTDAAPGQPVVRRTQYRLKDMAALERYVQQDAPRLRADAAVFGDKVAFSRRVLSPHSVDDRLPETPFACLNCGAPVPGRYCASCGQSREVHVLSMHEVVGDVTHSLLHLDSRAWNTLRTLVLRPGELTREFIAGRHQRYLPPFRLYLVISVMFFALSALLPDAQMLHVNAQGDTVIAYGASPPAAEAPGEAQIPPASGTELPGYTVNIGWPRLDALLQEAIHKLEADGGRRLSEVFLHTAPKLMFLFLPLMAGIAMLFYWRPRRLYAEHLVAFLHAHAFLFLALTATSIVNAIMRLDAPLVGLLGIVNLALMLYVPWYVFRAMRVVYGEGRSRTAVKFAAISLLYFTLLGITMVLGILYSMLSL